MHEIKFAIHIHTRYSDGNASHQELVKIAKKAGLDGIIITDHNIWLEGLEGYYGEGKKKTMLLVGEEIHDRKLDPPGNHLLVIGAEKEMVNFSSDPQQLIDQINRRNGLSFIAHPIEDPLEMFGEKAFSWRSWDIDGFSGIELWNQLSEFKSVSQSLLSAITHALFPKRMSVGPLERTLNLWDQLIADKKHPIIAIGGVDAHEITIGWGFFKIKIYPYLHHFKSVTTHILTEKPLWENFADDKKAILNALRRGHCFVAYDLPAPTDGFRFSVHTDEGQFFMGDQVRSDGGLTFQVRLPQKQLCRLFKDGKIIKEWGDREICTYITTEPGVYRVEVYIPYKGKTRGWIFSNPIYVLN